MKNNKEFKFIIYASNFNENSGGQIVLHKLCDILNQLGEKAYLYPYFYEPMIELNKPVRSLYRILRYLVQKIGFYKLRTNPHFNTPIINKKDINDKCIVVYPEIINGNPLKCKNVVRWFLHKPGFHTGEINYGKNELYFFYQHIFNDKSINPDQDNLLYISWIMDDIYKQTNFRERSGSCYMLRKGKNKKIVHNISNSILLDGKSHVEIAKIMNECEYFISYDSETMYSPYAVLCGCKSIVIPNEGVSKEQWQPIEELRYGVAYGFDDLEEAERTKHLVLEVLKKKEQESLKMVEQFIKKVYQKFSKK